MCNVTFFALAPFRKSNKSQTIHQNWNEFVEAFIESKIQRPKPRDSLSLSQSYPYYSVTRGALPPGPSEFPQERCPLEARCVACNPGNRLRLGDLSLPKPLTTPRLAPTAPTRPAKLRRARPLRRADGTGRRLGGNHEGDLFLFI